jgi:HD-GYP domain-containing protein (c-di-GMP phosphodiesterase class II)
VDPFAIIMLGGTAVLIIALMLIGVFHPRSGADVLQWKPTRSPEAEAQNEIDDLEQMVEAANERRRAKGRPERTLEEVEKSVVDAQHEQRQRHEQYLADQEIDELLALKNERRARRGLEPITREQYEADLKKTL